MGTVTVTKAAHILGVHPNTVRAWTDQGRLRCLRINARGDRRYRTADLESFLSGADAVGIQPRRGGRRVVPVSRGGGLSGGSRIGPFDGERPRAGEVPQDLDTGRRVEELRVIAEVARLTAHVADLGATLGEIGRVLRRTFSYQMVAILQALDGQLVVRAADGVDPATIMPLPLEAGLSGAAIRDGRPLFVPDVRDDPRYIPVLPQVRSEVAVPIFIGQEAWGCLVVADVRVDSLLEVDRELLTTIADQVASAAQNARLFGQVERQLRQADALRRISADVTSQLDLPVILNGLVEHALALFEADRAAVFLARPDGHMDAPIVRDLSATYLRAVELVPQPSLGAEVIATGRAGFVVDYANDRRATSMRREILEEGFDTVCLAPLVAAGEVLGLLGLYHDRRHAWDVADLEALEALASQASIAIKNARTYATTASWAAQLQSIQQLGARLNRLTSVQEIGWAICAELHQLIDYHNVRVYRVEGDDVMPVAWRGEIGEYSDEVEDQLKLRVGQGITGWVARHGVAQYLPNASADPRAATIPGTSDDVEESMLLAAMRFEHQVIGVIVLSKLGLHQFQPDDLRLLEIYASLAAQAIANADATERLRAQSATLERRARSQAELLRLTQAILTSLDPRVVLEAIADRLGMLVACDNLCIDVHDRRTGRLRPLVARGVHAQLWMAAVGPDTEGVGGWVVRHGQAQLVPDELADPRVRCFPELGPLAGSLMVVPLHGRDGIAGVLSLERLGSGRTFSDEEFELVQLFAAHASIAMQNAEAHRAVEIRAETDALTRLGNHGAFQDRLAWQVGQGERFSLVMLDLDNFKDYNDTFGHPAGDELLRELGHALRRSVRDNDNVYRYGGDEFTLLLPGTDPDGAKAVAEKIRQAVHDVHTGAGRQRQRRLACSLGLATFPDDGTEAESILLAADRAAYVSKRSGRDRITTAAEGRSLGEDFLPGAPTPVDEPGVAYGTA